MMNKEHTIKFREIFIAYQKMKQFCFDSTSGVGFHDTYDSRWRTSYVFYEDMASSWFPGAILDRIDPNKKFGPDNTEWIKPT